MLLVERKKEATYRKATGEQNQPDVRISRIGGEGNQFGIKQSVWVGATPISFSKPRLSNLFNVKGSLAKKIDTLNLLFTLQLAVLL